jgi:Tol biopolymer transport system component
MTTRILFTLIVLIFISSGELLSQKSEIEDKPIDYPSWLPGKDTAEIFAPGIISLPGTRESALTVSPDGNELFFVRGIWPNTKIMHMVKSEGKWSEPDTALFSENCWATEPAFSPDGRYIYYSTSKGKADIKDYNLWRVDKHNGEWSRAESIFDIGADSVWEFHPSLTEDGMLYFCYWDVGNTSGDIFVSRCTEKRCSEPSRAGTLVSTDEVSNVDPFVSPDGTYIIFASDREGGYGGHDQYISFKKDDGAWSDLVNPGAPFNTADDDYDMDISPDGKYIFLYLDGDIYWMPVGKLLMRSVD